MFVGEDDSEGLAGRLKMIADGKEWSRTAMISLVIPVFNEEENLPLLINRVRTVMTRMKRPWELILVDDGSWDRSLEILKAFTIYPEVRIIELTRNYGQHAAILAGFSIVRGEIVVTPVTNMPPSSRPLRHTSERG